MISKTSHSLNIRGIIERQAIETHFQPITSIRRKQIVGIEALSRGVDENHQLIPPAELFKSAAAEKLSLELDYVCRTKALENFLPLHKAMPELILFMNVHHAAFDLDGNNKGGLIAQVERFNFDPRNLAVEILESEFDDVAALRASIARYKQQGFLVALDDVGTGHSNLDRVTYIKPDIMKVDASLIQNIHLDYYKQEVFKSLVNLSEKIGGWIITEGVEEQAEAIVALELGGDFLQGFYLARPEKSDGENINCAWERVEETATKFKSHTLDKAKATQPERQTRARLAQEIGGQLKKFAADDFPRFLADIVKHYPLIESACVLNEAGVQITDTILNETKSQKQKSIIFRPPVKGTDHSLKEYYYVLRGAQIDPFETQPYVPLPSGDLCITVSTEFKDAAAREFILCLHTKV